jgi:hypothetical protein
MRTWIVRHSMWRLAGVVLVALVAGALVSADVVGAAERGRGGRLHRGGAHGDCLRVLAQGSRLSQTLDDLIADGTLTTEQAAAVEERIGQDASRADKLCAGLALFRAAGVGEAVRDLFQIEPRELREELRSGKSLAEIAQEHDVSRDQLIAAIETSLSERLDNWVEVGRIEAERAVEIKSELRPRIETLIDWHRGDLRDGAATPAST